MEIEGQAGFTINSLIITARILYSWFPQAQGVAILQPVFTITDPFLNLFRGIIPPLFGLDFSPIAAFLLLNVIANATTAVGYDLPPEKLLELRRLQQQKKSAAASVVSRTTASCRRNNNSQVVTMNL